MNLAEDEIFIDWERFDTVALMKIEVSYRKEIRKVLCSSHFYDGEKREEEWKFMGEEFYEKVRVLENTKWGKTWKFCHENIAQWLKGFRFFNQIILPKIF